MQEHILLLIQQQDHSQANEGEHKAELKKTLHILMVLTNIWRRSRLQFIQAWCDLQECRNFHGTWASDILPTFHSWFFIIAPIADCMKGVITWTKVTSMNRLNNSWQEPQLLSFLNFLRYSSLCEMPCSPRFHLKRKTKISMSYNIHTETQIEGKNTTKTLRRQKRIQ